MKIQIICSKYFYDRIPQIKNKLVKKGFDVAMPDSYDNPFREEEIKKMSREEHIEWKQKMMLHHEVMIRECDAVLVLNFEKNGQKNYIGGATFLEIFKAFELKKKVFLYNPIPCNIFTDEILGINPVVIDGDLERIK